MHPNEFNANTMRNVPPVTDSIANHHSFEKFLAFTLRQIEELLTRYGKIDVLWFDGMGFRGIPNMYTKEVYAWIRSLQPGIVINDRWSGVVNPDTKEGDGSHFGDFATMFEGRNPTYIPDCWWEHCGIWTSGDGGWGYEKDGTFLPYSWFFEHLVTSCSMGGNFLPNVGPSGDGEMHPNYYKQMAAVAQWMKHSKESVIGNGPTPGAERSNVMITTRGKSWYLHLLPDFKSQVSVKTDRKPKSVVLLRNGKPLQYNFRNGFVKLNVPSELRTEMDDVIKVELSNKQFLCELYLFEN
jgi:alpha-L-fucosidase